jgi:hypothetical protein
MRHVLSMAVAADNRHNGTCVAQFRSQDMNNSVVIMLHSKEIYAKFPGVPSESIDLVTSYFVLHGQMLVGGGNVMIGGGKAFYRDERLLCLFV